ncbi:MAG: MFS transporter, partial [Candidatus Hodarchaeota archaeon]
CAFLFTIITDFIGLIIIWSIFGIAQFCRSALDPIILDSIPKEHIGTGTSLYTLTGVFGILGLVFVGIFIAGDFVSGIRLFWILAAIGSFIDFLIRLIFLEQTEKKINQETGKVFLQDLIIRYKDGIKVVFAAIPLLFFVYLLDVISDISYNFAQNFFLNETVGMSYTSINYTLIGATIVGVCGGLLAGRMLDRMKNDSPVMFFAYFLLPFSVFLLFNSIVFPQWIDILPNGEIWEVIASTAFLAVVIKAGNDVIWRTISWGAIGRRIPREHTGKVMALLNMTISLFGVLLSPIIGLIYEFHGGYPLLLVAFILNSLILSFLFFSWIRTLRKKEKGKDP